MPTTANRTFSSLKLEPAAAPELAVYDEVSLNSGTYQRGQVLGQITATGKFAPYNNGASDGREVARQVLRYACVVDASGNVTRGDGTAGDEHGATSLTAETIAGGYVNTQDLVGLDAAGVADLGRLIRGSVSTGVLRIS